MYTKCVSLEATDAVEFVAAVAEEGLRLYDLNIANNPPVGASLVGAGTSLVGVIAGVVVGVGAGIVVVGRRSTYASLARSGRVFFTKNIRAAVSKWVYGIESFRSV